MVKDTRRAIGTNERVLSVRTRLNVRFRTAASRERTRRQLAVADSTVVLSKISNLTADRGGMPSATCAIHSGRACGGDSSRSALRRPHAAPLARLHYGGGAYAGTGHRRQHRRLQPYVRDHAAEPAGGRT